MYINTAYVVIKAIHNFYLRDKTMFFFLRNELSSKEKGDYAPPPPKNNVFSDSPSRVFVYACFSTVVVVLT